MPGSMQSTIDAWAMLQHERDNFIAMQHGYSHRNYAAIDAKKIELGGKRSTDEMHIEITVGRLQLGNAFGEQT